MEGARRPTLAQDGVRLVALLLLAACFANIAILPSSAALAAVCAGDEQIVLAPNTPRVGGRLMVAVFSHVAHEQALLIGPAGPIPVVRAQIGDSFLWQEMVALDHAGEHVFVFGIADGVAPFARCADATVLVAEAESPLFASLNSYGQGGSAVAGQIQPGGAVGLSDDAETLAGPEIESVEPPGDGGLVDGSRSPSPRRATRTPTPRPDNENENGNDNTPAATKTPTRTPTSTRVPTATRTPRPPATDTPEPTPTLGPPSLDTPSRLWCGEPFTLRGERFGRSRSAVDGEVRIDGREAPISDWRMTQIEGTVPITVQGGPDRSLEVVVNGKKVTTRVGITC